jgi:threonine/homoserine/homoserine lactone efflux protein
MLMLLFRGMLIGFMIAVPVGPIDLLCIRKTLLWGRRSGFITGMGAACADGLYGASAAFGLITLTGLLLSYEQLLQFIGGAFLMALGLRAWMERKFSESQEMVRANSLTLAFLTTFTLALMSPMTILSFIGAFAVFGLGFDETTPFETAFLLSLGVFLGSTAWWLMLANGVAILKNKINAKSLCWINRITGVIFFVFGFGAVVHALYKWA